MTNIAKAIDRLREERRDAQNQVQKLGEAISVLEKLTRGAGTTTGAGSSRQTCSFCSRTPENFSGSEGALGENQTSEESSLTTNGRSSRI